MRAETRPLGKWAVERVHVSGTCPVREGELNQVWNWVKGEGESCVRERVPWENWAAWVEEGSAPGAKISFDDELVGSLGWVDGSWLLWEGLCSILFEVYERRWTSIFRGVSEGI